MEENQINKHGALYTLLAAFALAALLCYLRWPLLALFSTHLLGGIDADTNLYFWLVTTFPHNLIERGWFETNSFYPYQNTLALSDNFLFPSIIFYFFNSITRLGDVESWNLLILISQFLNGFAVFLLAKRLQANWPCSLLISSVFIAAPFFAQNLGHPQLQFFYWIPFGFSCFLSLLEKPNITKAAAFAVIIALSFLSTVYFAVGLLLLCGIYFFLLCLSNEIPSKKLIICLLSSALISALLLFPFLKPYLSIKAQFGARALHEFYYFGLSALSFISSVPISKFYGASSVFAQDEAHFGWGCICLLLLLLGSKNLWKLSPYIILSAILSLIFADATLGNLFAVPRNIRLALAMLSSWFCLIALLFNIYKSQSNRERLLCSAAIILILIAMGPLGYKEINIPALGVFRFFYEVFPGLDALRAISRIGVVIILLLSLSAIPKLNSAGIKVLLLIPLLILESSVTSFPLAPLPQSPKIFEKLITIAKKDDAILITPIAGKLDKNNQVISWSELANINSSYLVALRNSRPLLLNGYSGQRPKTIYDLPRIFSRFPSEAALNKLLEFEKLKYIVIIGSTIDGFSEADFKSALSAIAGKVKIVAQEDKEFVIELLRVT